MARLLPFFLTLLILVPLNPAAQEIDDLFDDPDRGIIEEDQGEEDARRSAESEDPGAVDGETEDGADSTAESSEPGSPTGDSGGVDLDALTTGAPVLRGSLNARAGVALGLEEWPGTAAADGRGVEELRRASGFYDMSATLSVDARPEPYLRFYGSLTSDLDEDAMTFTGPNIGELFVDYTLRETLFFRAGKHSLTWGQGRLLNNPANLVSRVGDGVALRASYPLGAGSLNGVLYATAAWVDEWRPGDPRAFGYAGLYEGTVGGLTFELSTHYKEGELTGSAVSLTYGLGPVDLTLEGVGRWDVLDPAAGVQETGALAQLFWESEGGRWTVLGEYEFDSTVADLRGQYAGLALQAPALGRWRPRLRWLHAFQDNSGEILPALSATIAPSLSGSLGVPILYGGPRSYYRVGETIEEDESLPVEEVVSLLFGVSLSFSF